MDHKDSGLGVQEAYSQLHMISAHALFDAVIKAVRNEAREYGSFGDRGFLFLQMLPQSTWAYEWRSQMGKEDIARMDAGGAVYKMKPDGGAVRDEKQVYQQICEDGEVAEVTIYLSEDRFMTIRVGVDGGSNAANQRSAIAGTQAARKYFKDITMGRVVLLRPRLNFSDNIVDD